MTVRSATDRIRAGVLTALLGVLGVFELAACSVIVNGDPVAPPSGGYSVLHDLFPEVHHITEGYLPAGTMGGMAYGDFDCDGSVDLAIGDPDQYVDGHWKAGVVHVFYARGTTQTLYQPLLGIALAQEAAAFGMALAAGDFDGRNCEDLAIGAPGHGVSGKVHVVYGRTFSGLTPGDDDNQMLVGSQPREYFGMSLAAGRFDADDRVDLAIGVPKHDVGDDEHAGMVEVFYGSDQGLGSSEIFTQGSWYGDDVAGSPEDHDMLGFSLAVGDFDNNGIDDLAAGAPGECQESRFGSCSVGGNRGGAVNVFYGTAQGLQVSNPKSRIWSQNSSQVIGKAEDEDAFGFAVTTGDFDGDSYADLAIGVPGESVAGIDYAGGVNVLYGSSSGLQSDARDGGREDQFWDLDCQREETCGDGDLVGHGEERNHFGVSLAAGDLDGDGDDELAVGVPTLSTQGYIAGGVSVIRGTPSGLHTADNLLLTQMLDGLDGKAEPDDDDFFGAVLAIANVDGFGKEELTVRVNDGDYCAANVLHELGDRADVHTCQNTSLLAVYPFGIVDPDQEAYEEDPDQNALPGGYNLPHWDWEFAEQAEELELVAGPAKLRPGQALAVSWDVGSSNAPLTSALSAPSGSLLFSAILVGGGGTIGGGGTVGGGPGGEELAPVGNPRDWIGLYPVGGGVFDFVEWHYTDAIEDGFMLFTAPDTVGEWELRYMLDDSYDVEATSNTVLVVPEVALATGPASPVPDGPLGVCWQITAGQPFGPDDRVGLFEFGAPNDAPVLQAPTNGLTDGCSFFTTPQVGSLTRYQFRYLLSGRDDHAAHVDLTIDPAVEDAPEVWEYEPEPEPKCGLGSGLVLLLPALLRRRR